MLSNSRRMIRGLAAFMVLLAFASSAVAQTTLGRIVGVVQDKSGAVIANAKITAVNVGTKETLTGTSTSNGTFVVQNVPVGTYTVTIEANGMRTTSYKDVKVDTGKDYSLTSSMEVGAASETVEVIAGEELVNTSTSEITNTVSMQQVRELPISSRNPIALIRMQAGVPSIGDRQNAAINGGRPGWTAVTQDGINIQDNFIRVNGLDFVPNRPTTDNVAEFSITTNNLGADSAGGSSQVKMTTENGTNAYHGSLFWFNRNSFFGANSYANKNKVPPAAITRKPFLNRNQYGGRLSGPFIKNKLFFFGYYEAFLEARQVNATPTIPLNNDLLQGVYRYTSGGITRTVNVLTLAGIPSATRNVTVGAVTGPSTTPARTVDTAVAARILSRIPSASLVNVATTNLNVGQYSFNQGDRVTRHFAGGRADYELNSNHHFEGSYKWSIDRDLRNDLDGINPTPIVYTQSETKFYVGAWRWTLSPTMQNEVRVGGNLAPVDFRNDEDFASIGNMIYGGIPLITVPAVQFMPQGRNTRTYQYIDTFSWVKGSHSMKMGGSYTNARIRPYNFAGPTMFAQTNFGYSTAAPCNPNATCDFFGAGNFTGQAPSTGDLNNMNALRAFLSGVYTSQAQTFEVNSQTSGYVPNIPNDRNFTLNELAVYAQDSWRILPNLTLNYGLKWDYWMPLREDNNLMLEPILGNSATMRDAVLNPATTLGFVNGDLYKKDLNNFSPTFGFAWDPFKDGKTSVRGGYTLVFVNDEIVTAARNAVVGNAGLNTAVARTGLYGFLAAGDPVVPTPAFVTPPRTQAQQIAISSTAAIFGIDPNFQTSYVNQLNFGVQRELPWDMAVEARYVGTLGKKLIKGVDYNQNKAVTDAAFMAEFALARQNVFSACAAVTGPTCPNAAATMPTIVGMGFTSDTGVVTAIRNNAPASLADFYVANRTFFPASVANTRFIPNNAIYVADVLENGGWSNYHGLQLEARRRMKHGLFGQVNYTWSKNIANVAGTSQARFEPLLDNNRPDLEKRISDFHVSHIINGNIIYELPFGRGKTWANDSDAMDKLVGGWQVSSIVGWQTGAPHSIVSARGSFNRAGRSGLNTAVSNLSRQQIQDLFGVFRGTGQPGGGTLGVLYWINPSVICPTGGIGCTAGQGVNSDNLNNTASTSFNQIFFNPTPGQIGNLGINAFTGPSQFVWDAAVSKRTKITERFNVEFRAEFFNFTNHTNFFMADQNNNINGGSFGVIPSGSVNGRDGASQRVMQFALKLNF